MRKKLDKGLDDGGGFDAWWRETRWSQHTHKPHLCFTLWVLPLKDEEEGQGGTSNTHSHLSSCYYNWLKIYLFILWHIHTHTQSPTLLFIVLLCYYFDYLFTKFKSHQDKCLWSRFDQISEFLWEVFYLATFLQFCEFNLC